MSAPKRWGKRIAIAFGALLMLPIVGLGLVLTALQFTPVRAAVRDELLGLIQGSLEGRLEVDDWRWPSIRHVELSGVRLWDRHDKLVANVGMVSAHIDLAPLFAGKIHLSEVNADGLFIDLGTPGTDRGLLSVFESDAPKQPEPQDSGSTLEVQIERLCLEGSALEVQPTPDQGIGIHRFATCAMFRMAENIDLRLDELRAYVALNGQSVVKFIDEPALRAYDSRPPGETAWLAQALLTGEISIADTGPGFDGRLELRNIGRQTFEAAGVAAEWLTGVVDGSVVVDGSAAKMKFAVELRAPETTLRVQGDFEPEKSAQARVWSDGLELARFTTIATERIVFDLGVNANLARADGPRVAAELRSGSYGTWPLPKLNADAEFAADGTISVPRVLLRYPAGEVLGRARIGAGGAINAGLEVKLADLAKIPPISAALPGWRGQLNANAKLQRAAETGKLSIEAQTTLQRLRADSPALAADRVELKAAAWGPADQLSVKANLSGAEVHFNDQRFAEMQLVAHGGPDLYKLQGRVDGNRGRLDVWLKPSDGGLEAGGQVVARLPRGEATASVERVHLASGNSLEIQGLRAEHLGAKLTGDGTLGLGDAHSRLRIEARIDNLSALTHELANTDVPGKLFVSADLSGALDKPNVDLRLDFREGPRLAGAASELDLRAKLEAAKGQAVVTARAVAGKANVRAELTSRWPRRAPLSAAVDGHHELDVVVDRVAIGELVRKSDTPPPIPIAGTLGAKLHVSGNASKLDVKSEVNARVTLGEEPELGAKITTNYGGGGLAVNAEVTDPHGNLVTVNWHQATQLERFAHEPLVLPDWLGESDWEATVELASRRIAELPSVSTKKTLRELWPLRAQASIQLAHKAGTEPIGDVLVKTSWDPNTYDPMRADCTQRVRPEVELKGKLRDGLFVSELRGAAGGKQMFSVQAQLGSKLAEWLVGRPLQITRAQVTAKMQEFDLAQWPLACEEAAGTLEASFSATDLFHKSAKFHAKLGGRGIVVGPSLPFDFETQAQALPSGLDVSMRLDRIGGNALIKGSVPVSFYVHDPATSVDPNGDLALDVALDKVDAKSLLAMVPAVARPSGVLDGRIKVFGTLSKPRGSGYIQLHDVSLTLPKIGQRLTKVNGRVGIEDNRIKIPELELRDQGGSAKFVAELALESTEDWKLDLRANFDDFPVRRQGVLIGRADAAAKVRVKTTAVQTDAEVRLSNVSVNLSGDTAADVQSLDDHPEITVFGEEPEAPDPEEEAAKQATIVNVYVRSDEPLWIRRDDFAVRMRPDVTVHVAQGTSQITGVVKLERGYIALMGQEFDIKEGTVTFTGGQEVNPQLELTAVSKSASGKAVRVEVTGFVSKPELAFFVDERPANAGEAVGALTGLTDDGGGGGQQQLEEGMASAAMGMTTGLLSLGARREFGDYIPRLSVEQDTESTRVRAGFEADKLIPGFLRGFVHGAYVEGVVSTGGEDARGNSEGGGNAQGGVLLELMLPSDLVWAGQYGPGETWSVDLNWRP